MSAMMGSVTVTHTGGKAVLDRRLYTFGEVDALARLKPGTARRWLEGYQRGQTFYPPLLRPEPTGDELVTWGEFVEVDLVGRYRRKELPVVKLRPMLERLRTEVGDQYPLAIQHPLVYGLQLLLTLQHETGVPDALRLAMQLGDGQLVLTPVAQQYFMSVEWVDEVARRIMPDGPDSPVRIDPLRAFGRPTVQAVRTERLAEAFRAGDSIESLAKGYELGIPVVEAAIRFETVRTLAAA
jgi:uncharacterized protein (DUF433 family)